ncbi:hypothetical protein LTR08_000307 [Meristemomyces frigidus]|nr:hypothetical protein LTR08_000307 [Meristemomyces frigidus]
MLSTHDVLEGVSKDGSIDMYVPSHHRCDDIVHNDFPLPTLPRPIAALDPEVVASTPPLALPASDHDDSLPDASGPPTSSQDSTKENDAPPATTTPARPPVPGFEANHTPQPASAALDSIAPPATLPPELLSLYHNSTLILERDFAHSPPYTIQRLAELVLHPTKHYRFLPAYLRALDRIVSVSSPVGDFPLPALVASVQGGFLTNGDSHGQVNGGAAEREGLGSDESLGGALLTPIPWLRHTGTGANGGGEGELHSESTETIEGPNGAGSVETVSVTVNGVPSLINSSSVAHTSPTTPASPTLSEQSDASSSSSAESTEALLRQQGGVTQGELLRQEQEAGVVPVSQSGTRRSLVAAGAVAVGREAAAALTGAAPASVARDAATRDDVAMDDPHPSLPPAEESPHARGPEVVGVEDMGLQRAYGGGLDMEAAVGRGRSPLPERAEGGAEVRVEGDVEMEGQRGGEGGGEAGDGEGSVAVVADGDERIVGDAEKEAATG